LRIVALFLMTSTRKGQSTKKERYGIKRQRKKDYFMTKPAPDSLPYVTSEGTESTPNNSMETNPAEGFRWRTFSKIGKKEEGDTFFNVCRQFSWEKRKRSVSRKKKRGVARQARGQRPKKYHWKDGRKWIELIKQYRHTKRVGSRV